MTNISQEPGQKLRQLGGVRTMELEAPLTDAERAGLNAQVAAVSQETFALEAEKKEVVAPINDKLKEAKARERDLLGKLAKGTMPKPVPVRTMANFFRREKWVERLDGEEPEEVPEMRSALTDAELQAVLPGVVLEGDNRPDAQLLPLFAVRGNPETVPVAWTDMLPKPLESWRVEAKGDEYQLVDTRTWEVFGPFRHSPGKGLTWADTSGLQIPEDKQSALETATGGALHVAALLGAMGELLSARGRQQPTTKPKPWEAQFPAPLERWTVSEPEPGQYLLTDDVADDATEPKSWGPYNWKDDGFLMLGTEEPLADEDFNELGQHLASEGSEQERDDAATALLAAASDAVRVHVESQSEEARQASVPEGGLKLHPLPGLEGWGLYLHAGFAYLRAPNLDRFTPPGDSRDKGPLEWDVDGGKWELADSAPSEMDEWVREQGVIMTCADSLVKQGKVTPPVLEAGAGVALSPGEAAASAAGDEKEGGTVTTLNPSKLSDYARAVLKLLAGPDAPTDAHTIGNRARCKAGAVLNGLEKKDLVERREGESEESWHITELGRTVAATLTAGK